MCDWLGKHEHVYLKNAGDIPPGSASGGWIPGIPPPVGDAPGSCDLTSPLICRKLLQRRCIAAEIALVRKLGILRIAATRLS